MKRINSLLIILVMSLVFVGCDKKPEPPKPTPGGKENPTPNPDPEPNPDPDPTPEPEEQKSELPLLAFSKDKEEIMRYETELGRKGEAINYRGSHFDGYANDDFKVIPAVIYGLQTPDGSTAILALGMEKIDNPSKTLAMLKEAGFDVEKKDGTDNAGNKMIGYSGENKEGVKVQITALEETQFETNIQIIFSQTPEMKFNKNAKDFPSYEALMSKNLETIIKFETDLGLRRALKESGGDFWDETKLNLLFKTIPGKIEAKETNISLTYYVNTPSKGPSFIEIIVKGITGAHLQSDEVKEWLALNGFDSEIRYDPQNAVLSAYNTIQKVHCYLFWQRGSMYLQIFNPIEGKRSPAKVRKSVVSPSKANRSKVITPVLFKK